MPLSASDERHAVLMRSLEQEIAHTVSALGGQGLTDSKLTYEARAVIARFDKDRLWAAELRAREALADHWQHRDYSLLSRTGPFGQNAINQIVRIVLQSHQIALEGHSSPLAPSRAAELSPERRTM